MIYTVTFNPSLDYIIQVDDFKTGQINKTKFEKIAPGGKGINVSIVLSNLGYESTALGFIAGFTGKEIQNKMKSYQCNTDFIEVNSGLSRINIKMKSDAETEINGQGPAISSKDIKQLFSKLDQLTSNDLLIISGSIPNSLPNTIYEQILEHLKGKHIKIIIDATKTLLLNTLPYHPFLIKPNHHELSEIFGIKLKTKEDIIPYALKLKEMGAKNVIISMAEQGAICIDEQNNIYQYEAPKGIVINSVGAGDSMIAGFITGYLETQNYEYAFKKGICTGSASAFCQDLAKKEDVNTLMKDLI